MIIKSFTVISCSDGLQNALGSYRHGARRGSVYTVKDGDGSSVVDGKSLKRAGSSGFGSEVSGIGTLKPIHLNFMLANLVS